MGLLVHGVHPVHEDVDGGLPGHVHAAVGGLEAGRDLHLVDEVEKVFRVRGRRACRTSSLHSSYHTRASRLEESDVVQA